MPQYNDRSGAVSTLAAVLSSFSLLSVVLRFIARSRRKARYGPDDWWASTSLVTLLAWMGVVIWTAQNGSGYDVLVLPPPIMTNYLKGVYLTALLSTIPITAAKLSVLYLYRRLFYLEKRFCTATTIVGVLCLLWFIVATVAVSLKCIPVDKSWNPLKPGSCYNIQVFMVAVECPNSFLDFVIVALPVGVIRRLHLPLRRRILICFIFALGGFVGVIGFIRIAMVYTPNTLNLTLLGHWLQIQLSIAVICASLPTYGPLLPSLTRVKGWYSSMSSVFEKRRQNSCSSSSSSDSNKTLCPNCKNIARQQKNPYGSFSDASEKTAGTSLVRVEEGGRGGNYLHYQQPVEGEEPAAGAAAAAETYHYHRENFIRIRNEVETV